MSCHGSNEFAIPSEEPTKLHLSRIFIGMRNAEDTERAPRSSTFHMPWTYMYGLYEYDVCIRRTIVLEYNVVSDT